MSVASYTAIGFVRVYQLVLSPLKATCFGTAACCRYTPSCSCYAIDAFRAHGFLRGGMFAARRVLRCHPWGGAGYDPVPAPECPMIEH